MKPISELSDEELIQEHASRWRSWLDRRKQFGEMGATGDTRMTDLEWEAKRRQIPDDVLMAPVKDYESPLRQLLP